MSSSTATTSSRPGLGSTFLHLLVNTAVAGLTTSFLWFALTFWAYLETRSVLATGIIGGAYMLFVSLSSIMFGSVVDHHRKIMVMRFSSVVTLTLFAVAGLFYLSVPSDAMTDLGRPWFWLLAVVILVGSVVEHMRNIALSTCVTILVPDGQRARANGLVGTAQGISFMATSFLSGLAIGLLGMGWTLALSVIAVALGLAHLSLVRMPEEREPAASQEEGRSRVDLPGTLRVILGQAGLLALILFATFNNLIGGVYMALMDPYGLEMFPVELWGAVLGVTSIGFIVGGSVVAKVGLGSQPLRTLLLCAVAMGVLGSLFTIREWWWVYALGIFLYMCLIPAAEAAEQTILQRVVPLERQGRVFGFAMAVETAAAPLTAFLIAPLADRWIIPYAGSEEGRRVLEPLLGVGTPESRGIALVFVVAGLVMVIAAVVAMLSPPYRALSRTYADSAPVEEVDASGPVEIVTTASGAAATAALGFLDDDALHDEGPELTGTPTGGGDR